MHVSIEDFKELPVIWGNLNLKWQLHKLFPKIDFNNLVSRLDLTYHVKYMANLKEYKEKNPEFDEASIWQYIPQYKIKYGEKGLSIFLALDIGPSHGFLFKVDTDKRELRLLN